MVTIKYNSQNLFDGVSPTPYVGLSKEISFLSKRAFEVNVITLEGTIYSECAVSGNFGISSEKGELILTEAGEYLELSGILPSPAIGLLSKRSILINRLSESFKSFSIEEDGEVVFSSEIAKVRSVNFQDSTLGNSISYSITLESYDPDDFKFYSGVTDLVNTISFSPNEERLVTITHTISGTGVKVSSAHPLQNVRDFINSVDPVDGFSTLFNGNVNGSISLISEQETVSRVDNTLSIVRTYMYDPNNANIGLVRYTTSVSQDEQGRRSVSVSGSVLGGDNHTMVQLRNRYKSININSIVESAILFVYPSQPIKEHNVSKNITEDAFANSISFSFEFVEDNQSEIITIDNVSVSSEVNGANSVTVSYTIKKRNSLCSCTTDSDWNSVTKRAASLQLFAKANSVWYDFGGRIPLRSQPISTSKSINRDACEMTISNTFGTSNALKNTLFMDINYTVSVSPAMPLYSHSQTTGSINNHYIQDLNLDRRASVSISGSATKNNCVSQSLAMSTLRSIINNLAGTYVKGTNKIMDSGSITEPKDGGNVFSFSFTWSSNANRELNISWH